MDTFHVTRIVTCGSWELTFVDHGRFALVEKRARQKECSVSVPLSVGLTLVQGDETRQGYSVCVNARSFQTRSEAFIQFHSFCRLFQRDGAAVKDLPDHGFSVTCRYIEMTRTVENMKYLYDQTTSRRSKLPSGASFSFFYLASIHTTLISDIF